MAKPVPNFRAMGLKAGEVPKFFDLVLSGRAADAAEAKDEWWAARKAEATAAAKSSAKVRLDDDRCYSPLDAYEGVLATCEISSGVQHGAASSRPSFVRARTGVPLRACARVEGRRLCADGRARRIHRQARLEHGAQAQAQGGHDR
jgi:hypothetical protein